MIDLKFGSELWCWMVIKKECLVREVKVVIESKFDKTLHVIDSTLQVQF